MNRGPKGREGHEEKREGRKENGKQGEETDAGNKKIEETIARRRRRTSDRKKGGMMDGRSERERYPIECWYGFFRVNRIPCHVLPV